MKQALAALLGAGFMASACYAIGVLFIDYLQIRLRRMERIPLAFTLGASLLHLAVFITLTLHVTYWPVLLVLQGSAILIAYRTGSWRLQGSETQCLSRQLQVLIGLTSGAFFMVYFFNAWAPEHSPDGASYHLGIIARELQAHGFEYINTNMYAMLSQGVELIFLPAFAIGRHSSAALIHLCFAVVLAMALLAFGRRLGRPWVGAAAALLTFLSPVVGRTASIAYVDVAAAAIVFSAFYWLEIWDSSATSDSPDSRNWKLLIPIGLLSGYAYAAKYTTVTIAIYAIGFVLWRTRRLRPVLLLCGCAAIMAGPWLARNWIVYQNPIAPLGNWLFHNPNVHVSFEHDYSAFLRHYSVPNKWTLPKEVTILGQNTQGLLGPVFLLLPLGLLALRYPLGRRLWLAGILLFLPYFGNIGTRFLIPSLPFFSLLMSLALGESPLLLGTLIVAHAITSWPTVVPHYAAPYRWWIENIPYRAALRIIDQDQYLRDNDSDYRILRMLDKNVPENEPILSTTGFPESYSNRHLLVAFQSASNESLTDLLYTGWTAGDQDTRIKTYRFPAQTGRRFRVTQIATATEIDQWSVHELRFFHNGMEVSRKPEWRLEAWPNPWEVQLAFDNTPATRWRSWETAGPGMYIQVDFGKDETVDEVRVETSPDTTTVRMEVDMQTPTGEWKTIGQRVENSTQTVSPLARRMATYELAKRGVHYLVLHDDDILAPDIRMDPQAWGLTLVDKEADVRLYKTIWK